ncbi:Chromatin assembly factor 1 subunit [Thecaphora frezii]
MVRSATFEIRWHDTQPIYSCSFQPISPQHLKRVLDHNLGQAAGLAPGKTLAGHASGSSNSTAGSNASAPTKAIQPPIMAGGQSWRLATAGGDNNARLWMVHPNVPSPAALASAVSTSGSAAIAPHPPRVEYLATLSRHSGVVNVVKFCPRGEMLATAGDDGNVLFWVPSDRNRPGFGDVQSNLDDGESQFEKEFWRVKLMTRATQQELYDMAWSPNGETLAVGGTDFVARIINVQDGHVIREISEHNHYVQGIAWDPLQEFIATQSSDRSVHIHSLQLKQKHDQSEASSSASTPVLGTHLANRSSRLDLHRRNGSSSSAFIWDASAKPPMKRRGSSHASQASDSEGPRESFVAGLRGRSKRSTTPMDAAHLSVAPRASTPSQGTAPQPAGSLAQPATPTASVPPSPFSATAAGGHAHAMNPPQTTPSRRSSFSGSNMDVASPPTSATSLAPASLSGSHVSKTAADVASHPGTSILPGDGVRRAGSTSRSASRTRSVRSPSPIPPLPAIRAPPSPKQRMQAAVAASGLAKNTLRLYGDENFSGFFRRLSFSPDGALLVTPSGLFDPPPAPPLVSSSVQLSPTKSPSPSLSGSLGRETTSASAASINKSAVYLYARGNFSRSNAPIAVLPGHKTATLVVRFSPILYELRKTPRSQDAADVEDDGIPPHPTIPLEVGKQKSVSLQSEGFNPSSAPVDPPAQDASKKGSSITTATGAPRGISVIGLPYRMVYAVATQDSVWIYDTQQTGPICCFSNMHYASFTDLTWSPDGQTLMMSSTDGYCSVVVFDYAELGIPYSYTSQPSLQTPTSGTPAPAHIATGSSLRSAPSTPQLPATTLAGDAATGPSMTASTPPPPPPPPATASSASTGLGLAIGAGIARTGPTLGSLPAAVLATASPSSSTASTSAPVGAQTPAHTEAQGPSKKKRRIAPTLERPLGQ